MPNALSHIGKGHRHESPSIDEPKPPFMKSVKAFRASPSNFAHVEMIRAILVDDEEGARDVLENLLRRFCPSVELLAKCENVPQAVEAIRQLKPDLVFLDIEMPNYAGYELVKFFEQVDFEIIFVTAYDQYAIRAFELAAIDYLLKPVDIERLKASVGRVRPAQERRQQVQRMELLGESLEEKVPRNLIVNDRGQQLVVAIADIVAIEAQESYCILHLEGRRLMASRNLKHFETLLSSNGEMLRVHKSWMVNKTQIKHYSRTELLIHLTGGIVAKLSKYQKTEFEEALKG
jgi:two-component system LytT family response regulator